MDGEEAGDLAVPGCMEAFDAKRALRCYGAACRVALVAGLPLAWICLQLHSRWSWAASAGAPRQLRSPTAGSPYEGSLAPKAPRAGPGGVLDVASGLPSDGEGGVLPRRAQERSSGKAPYHWVPVNEHAEFSPRYAHASVIGSDQRMYVVGGATSDVGAGGEYLNDVWVSSDQGRSWTTVTPRSERFSPRRGHALVMDCHGEVMFLFGGFRGKDSFMNDWWTSETGSVWHSMGEAPWSPRHGHAAVTTSKEVVVLLGGHDGTSYLNDVWSIQDPSQSTVESSWQLAASRASWSPRYGHAVVVNSLDTILLMGGFFADKQSGQVACFNDVWVSDDGGYTWTLVVEHAPWSGRYQHAAIMNTRDEVFVIGGLGVDLDRYGDVWRSEDSGQTWTQVSPAAPWAARYEHTALSDRNNSLYILGGMSSGDEKFNDIWRSERTCADDVRCPGETTVCRDGMHEHFEGLDSPVCVGICDHRIFDDCSKHEACRVQDQKATCVDPCETERCGQGEVCEVAKRHEVWHGELLSDARAYCLACDSAKSKYTCGKLKQCNWRKKDEACMMRCTVMESESACGADEHCEWADGKCSEESG